MKGRASIEGGKTKELKVFFLLRLGLREKDEGVRVLFISPLGFREERERVMLGRFSF